MNPRQVVLLGATGSVGTQAVDVIRRNPAAFSVLALASGGQRLDELAELAVELDVAAVAVAAPLPEQDVLAALAAAAHRLGRPATRPTVLIGPMAAAEAAAMPCDVVLNAMTGSVGLGPSLAALSGSAVLALANKESLVAGGDLVRAAAGGDMGRVVPVDSEHSALAQCLRSGSAREVRRLVLTASGGPFRGRSVSDLAAVTPAQALAHPTWQMGPVVTINSATLMNKGLEMIEAHELFGIDYRAIDVVVHPQSLIHSMVEFLDGSTIAQLSPPDMRLPISLALGWPDRVPDAAPAMDWAKPLAMTFEPLDATAFPAVQLARAAGLAGGTAPGVLNAANEEAVEAFLTGRLPFQRIIALVEEVLAEHKVVQAESLAELQEVEAWARVRATELVGVAA